MNRPLRHPSFNAIRSIAEILLASPVRCRRMSIPLQQSKGLALIERYFHLVENKTTVRREFLGGLTTFLTMAYIVVVNPQILSQAGMPAEGVVFATCISAAAATLVMGLYANYPIALAPGHVAERLLHLPGLPGHACAVANRARRHLLFWRFLFDSDRNAGARADREWDSRLPQAFDCRRHRHVHCLRGIAQCEGRRGKSGNVRWPRHFFESRNPTGVRGSCDHADPDGAQNQRGHSGRDSRDDCAWNFPRHGQLANGILLACRILLRLGCNSTCAAPCTLGCWKSFSSFYLSIYSTTSAHSSGCASRAAS